MAEMMMMTCNVFVYSYHIMVFAAILGEGHVMMMISELHDEGVSCVHPCSHFSPVELGNKCKKVNPLPYTCAQLRSRQQVNTRLFQIFKFA